jgi:L-fuconolactonase
LQPDRNHSGAIPVSTANPSHTPQRDADGLPIIHHLGLNPAWLKLHHEAALEPDLPIIDPHHHLWERDGGYLLDDILADTGSGHRVLATVFAQCGYAYRTSGPVELRPVGETAFAAGVARAAEARKGARPNSATRVCAGIVGHADMQLGDAVEPVLQAHIEAGAGHFRGIRHITANHAEFNASLLGRPPADLLQRPNFRAGLEKLQSLGLSFDAWLYHTQIDQLTELARAMPALPIAINHVGGPLGVGPYQGRRDATFTEWRAAMQKLSSCPNVVVKLGGLGMALGGFDFHLLPKPPSSEQLAAAWGPLMQTSIELFGAQRCMFESNFPVDKAMTSYAVLWNAYKRIAKGASSSEKAALFMGTANKFYRLNVSAE